MKLADTKVMDNTLDKRFLIPSVISIGMIPLIMREHVYNTHLTNQTWFAPQPTDTDFYLFYKQWTTVILAGICLILLLVRSKRNYEELPWNWKQFSPALVYMAFVMISAIFSIRPLFAFAGGYEMMHSALALLSYMVILYYTYTCIVSADHVIWLFRYSSIFICIEIILCFCTAAGFNFMNTQFFKALIVSPKRFKSLASLTVADSVAGTLYNADYLSMYVPIVVPMLIVLAVLEKDKWRRWLSVIFAGMAVFSQYKASTAGLLGMIGAFVIGWLIIASRKRKSMIISLAIVGIIIAAAVCSVAFVPAVHDRVALQFAHVKGKEDSDVPIKSIKTGNKNNGVRFVMKDGRTLRFTFFLNTDLKVQIHAWDGDGKKLETSCINEDDQVYVIDDERFSDMFFMRDDSIGISTIDVVMKDDARSIDPALVTTSEDVSSGSYTDEAQEQVTDHVADAAHELFGEYQGYCAYAFTNSLEVNGKSITDYYFVTWAGKATSLPQKDMGEVYEIFPNGFWSGRGYIYNRTLPLLKKYIFKGAGADNFVMAFPQSFFVRDNYIEGKYNSVDVKPHCYYLQLWVQEGFIAFVAVMIFVFGYLIQCIGLYRKTDRNDNLAMFGFAVAVSITGYMISVIAIDSNSCTAPVFWTVLGVGMGINRLMKSRNIVDKK